MRLKAQTEELAEHSEALAEAMGLNTFVRKGVWWVELRDIWEL